MTTVRQIERLWDAKAYARLLRETLANRPESSLRVESDLTCPAAAAAMAIVRLDELTQSYVPLYARLVRHLLQLQADDSSWGDPMTTALCIRALACGDGHGVAVERGLDALKHLQRDDGLWPAVGSRRMPGDEFTTVFVVLQVAGLSEFALSTRRAITTLSHSELTMDAETRRLWDRAKTRLVIASATGPIVTEAETEMLWS